MKKEEVQLAINVPKEVVNNGDQQQSTWFSSAFSVFLYCLCSMSLTLLNKAVVYTYKMDDVVSLVLIFQLLTAILITLLAKHVFRITTYPPLSLETAKRFVPLSIAYIFMLQSSLWAFSKVSVPLFNTLKNMSTILTFMGEVYLFQQKPSIEIYMTFLVMIAGSVLVVVENFSFTPLGLIYTFINIIATSTYLLYMRYVLRDKSLQDLGKAGPVLYSNAVSIPFLALIVLLNGEYRMERWYTADSQYLFNSFSGLLAFSALLIIGGSMQFATNYCIKNNSVTTYSMAGSLNKVPLAVLGVFLFSQYPSTIGWISISIGLIGGILYSYSTASASRQQQLLQENVIDKEQLERNARERTKMILGIAVATVFISCIMFVALLML
jgi:GDP-mannose transporter